MRYSMPRVYRLEPASHRRGATLIEVLVVIAIIGLLVAIVCPQRPKPSQDIMTPPAQTDFLKAAKPLLLP